MEPCVTPVDSSPSLVFGGNVLSVQIMTFVQPVTMETSITWDTDSTGSPPRAVRGWSTLQCLMIFFFPGPTINLIKYPQCRCIISVQSFAYNMREEVYASSRMHKRGRICLYTPRRSVAWQQLNFKSSQMFKKIQYIYSVEFGQISKESDPIQKLWNVYVM